MSSDFYRLLSAVKTNNLLEAEILLANGVDPNINNKYGDGLVYLASLNNNIKMMDLLLRYGEREPMSLLLAMIHGVETGNTEMIDVLLSHGVSPNIKGKYDLTPLYFASSLGNIDMVKFLLERNANPNLKTEYIMNPLFIAVRIKNLEIANILLERGADPNIQSRFEGPLLHDAIGKKNKNMVELLLYYNANPSLRNRYGLNAYEYAIKKGRADIAQLIESYPYQDIKEPDTIS